MAVKVQALFCDDVRRDENGPFILIGVHPGSILVEPAPAKKSLDNWIQISGLNAGKYSLRLRVVLDEESDTRVLANQMTEINPKENSSVILAPTGLAVSTASGGMLRLLMTVDDGEEEEIARVAVRVKPKKAVKKKSRKDADN
ncbi:hypothetical protein QO004_000445 [Rhizobium mesoamericanum]|uniref:hypothetical protein n=1 Tax=Rhizobium mesoamericanum TaxID=1079800 RepID=UPI00277F5A8B|nr:hypothetical protein [Rhizobium mesoamericanum]MDQ0558670.1 hypothetical protein [Rhizobium mesoamericanum]